MLRRWIALPILISSSLVFVLPARAQNNCNCPVAPKTKLEALEAGTGTLIIRGAAWIGTVSAKGGAVSVRCREVTDTVSGRREYGLAIGVTETGHPEAATLIDDDEIGALMSALDTLNKLDWSVTSLSNFAAVYTTRGELTLAALGRQRQSSIEYAVRGAYPGVATVSLSRDQLSQLQHLVAQAKEKLDSIRTTR